MTNKIDWSKHTFRCSQLSKLLTGNIGLTEKQKEEMLGYQQRKMDAALDLAKPLPPSYEAKLAEYIEKDANKEIPKTMQSELRKIWREVTFKRDFIFTNKYVQKGISQEERATTDLQLYYNKILKIPSLFTQNKQRFHNEWISGEPDVRMGKGVSWEMVVDTKCSWSLATLPFGQDELDLEYEAQNQGYMWLTGAERAATAHVLVNATEHQLYLEKQKFYYAYNSPSEGDVFFEEMMDAQRKCELNMIVDMAQFKSEYPNHDFVVPYDEWMGEGYDIALEHRVVIRESAASDEFRNEIKERIRISREYLTQLNDIL